MKNTTFSLGEIALLDKVEKDFGLVSGVFDGVTKKAKNFKDQIRKKEDRFERQKGTNFSRRPGSIRQSKDTPLRRGGWNFIPNCKPP